MPITNQQSSVYFPKMGLLCWYKHITFKAGCIQASVHWTSFIFSCTRQKLSSFSLRSLLVQKPSFQFSNKNKFTENVLKLYTRSSQTSQNTRQGIRLARVEPRRLTLQHICIQLFQIQILCLAIQLYIFFIRVLDKPRIWGISISIVRLQDIGKK